MTPLETTCLAHRYLYYVRATPVISDYEYDQLERRALEEAAEDSPLRQPGSDLEGDYLLSVRVRADQLLEAAGL